MGELSTMGTVPGIHGLEQEGTKQLAGSAVRLLDEYKDLEGVIEV